MLSPERLRCWAACAISTRPRARASGRLSGASPPAVRVASATAAAGSSTPIRRSERPSLARTTARMPSARARARAELLGGARRRADEPRRVVASGAERLGALVTDAEDVAVADGAPAEPALFEVEQREGQRAARVRVAPPGRGRQHGGVGGPDPLGCQLGPAPTGGAGGGPRAAEALQQRLHRDLRGVTSVVGIAHGEQHATRAPREARAVLVRVHVGVGLGRAAA